jgi:hypothetical protein
VSEAPSNVIVWIDTRGMIAERHELHELVDELPEAQVAALADVRRRLPRSEGKAWAPEFFGIVDGADLPADPGHEHR